jgi:hypothetical protein
VIAERSSSLPPTHQLLRFNKQSTSSFRSKLYDRYFSSACESLSNTSVLLRMIECKNLAGLTPLELAKTYKDRHEMRHILPALSFISRFRLKSFIDEIRRVFHSFDPSSSHSSSGSPSSIVCFVPDDVIHLFCSYLDLDDVPPLKLER